MNNLNRYPALEELYDKYGRTVYGIVLRFKISIPEAEEIVCELFRNLDLKEIEQLKNISVRQFLISHTIEFVRNKKGEVKMESDLHNVTYMNEILYKQKSLEELCNDNQKSRAELFKAVRRELQMRSGFIK
ncbi:MAG: hypothetical protein IPN61_01505 [Bacteroidetes bacterium]|nr:hypothetical protein [Bacteroidota bacterium]MBK8363172.1 hypothetical protein [Bacteroidota bacterium]MBK9412091.1 hypothetical protein [Bacteroidota bacterium]MBP6427969.1 hypothetical protein [Bacteroidia bacterium]MBP6658635.1 hypothetical protein [Bacteroidia bacterium]